MGHKFSTDYIYGFYNIQNKKCTSQIPKSLKGTFFLVIITPPPKSEIYETTQKWMLELMYTLQ